MEEDQLKRSESSQRQWYDTLQHQEAMSTLVQSSEYNLFSILKPKIYRDGNKWCVLYGENLQTGISGFGETPYDAILNWTREFHKPITPPSVDNT